MKLYWSVILTQVEHHHRLLHGGTHNTLWDCLYLTYSNDKGEPIPADVISGSNRLVFTSPTVSDSANYTCTFQNVSYTFELIIDPQPTCESVNIIKLIFKSFIRFFYCCNCS